VADSPVKSFILLFFNEIAAVVYAAAGPLLLVGRKTRAAATWLGLAVLLVVLIVYVPFGVAKRASRKGINYLADTLMYCGAVLLLADAMPREAWRRDSSASECPISGLSSRVAAVVPGGWSATRKLVSVFRG
jgi:hypothetical protein